MRETSINVPYSLVLLGDASGPLDVPRRLGAGQLVAATASCIAIGTLAEVDGPTKLRLCAGSDAMSEQIVFEGSIDLPSRIIALHSVDGLLLQMPVASTEAKVVVCANDGSEPNIINVYAT